MLAVISFWSIQNEELIVETNYKSAIASMEIAIAESIKKEEEALVKAVRYRHGFSSNEDFLQDSLPGVLSLFVFKNKELFFPKINAGENSEIYMPNSEDAFALKEFLDLQQAKRFAEAREYALQKVDFFKNSQSIARLGWDSYFLEKMLSDILSEETLGKEEREKFWKILGETKRLFQTLNAYSLHRDFLLALGGYACFSNDGYSFIRHEGEAFLTISSPEVPDRSAIIALIDSAFYSSSMSRAVSETAKEWSYIPYSISGEFPFGKWNVLIEEDFASIREKTRRKMAFLYAMLFFSLVIPVIGVIVVYRGFAREKQLAAMKDNFLSTISHELKTPLTSVKMYSELIVRKPEKAENFTNIILKETNRLEGLIDAILNYTRMESGKNSFRWENINLSECVKKVCNSLDVIASGKGLELRREIADDCGITGDYPSIYSLVQNLVDNAIKYTAEGYIHVRLQTDEHGVSLSVADTGKGIPVNEQKNIFDGFYRVGDESTRETKGTGLGLAIVKRTADIHKASIILKSAPGRGAVFTVIFPLIRT
jgi:signal transduction histidine kinase